MFLPFLLNNLLFLEYALRDVFVGIVVSDLCLFDLVASHLVVVAVDHDIDLCWLLILRLACIISSIIGVSLVLVSWFGLVLSCAVVGLVLRRRMLVVLALQSAKSHDVDSAPE